MPIIASPGIRCQTLRVSPARRAIEPLHETRIE
jgi:hypothetical protein